MPTPTTPDLAGRSTPRQHPTPDRAAAEREKCTDRTSELARVLADGDPHTWITLRALHTPGRDGRCTQCRSSRQPADHWPCTLRTVADQAAALARPRPTGGPTHQKVIKIQSRRPQ